MTIKDVTSLAVAPRTETSSRALHRRGFVPGVVYGGAQDNQSVCLEQKELRAIIKNSPWTRLFCLKDDASQMVVIKDIQFHPVTDMPVHFDLLRVKKTSRVRVSLPIRFQNRDVSPGLKKGGVLNVVLSTLPVEIAAQDLCSLTVDLSQMDVGGIVTIKDLGLPKSVDLGMRHEDDTVANLVGRG